MKDRVEFTWAMTMLLLKMIEEGENPIVDYVKRSDQEQRRLFDAKLSKCDGVMNVSRHQRGMAVDLYFVKDGELTDPKKGHRYWHDEWERHGGKPMISWDKGHYEG